MPAPSFDASQPPCHEGEAWRNTVATDVPCQRRHVITSVADCSPVPRSPSRQSEARNRKILGTLRRPSWKEDRLMSDTRVLRLILFSLLTASTTSAFAAAPDVL